jgi:hypothetical protein
MARNAISPQLAKRDVPAVGVDVGILEGKSYRTAGQPNLQLVSYSLPSRSRGESISQSMGWQPV